MNQTCVHLYQFLLTTPAPSAAAEGETVQCPVIAPPDSYRDQGHRLRQFAVAKTEGFGVK